jgi:hypothetical protein
LQFEELFELKAKLSDTILTGDKQGPSLEGLV